MMRLQTSGFWNMMLVSLWLWTWLGLSEAGAENRALLIGVGDYPQLPPQAQLKGPSHDVAALRTALSCDWGFKPENIAVLVDRQATKAAILRELAALPGRTKPGDYLFIYFSGHGTSPEDLRQQKVNLELDPFTGAILPADSKTGRPEEVKQSLIIGKRDLQPLLKNLEQDREVLVVFDSCYSEQAVRSVGIPGAKPKFVRMEDLTGESQPQAHGAGSLREPEYPYAQVIYLAAATRYQKALDLTDGAQTLDGRPHGAMTDMLLRGLKGGADTDHDGRISYRELYHYLKNRVTEKFGHTPHCLYPKGHEAKLEQPVFGRKVSGAAVADRPTAETALKVKCEGLEDAMRGRIGALPGLQVVDSGHNLMVTRERTGYQIYLANGYPLLTRDKPEEVLECLKRRVSLKDLQALNYPDQKFNVFVTLSGNRGTMLLGETAKFTLQTDTAGYLMLLDVGPTGLVTVLYPHKEEDLRLHRSGELVHGEIKIDEPLGTECFKVFAFSRYHPELDRLRNQEFALEDPKFQDLLALVRRAGPEAAQMTLPLQTARQEDLVSVTMYP